MSRIAKADVNAALQTVAKAIIKAGGEDGRTSRAEMKSALKQLPRNQRPLADIFFKFIDHRDFKTGAQVTARDVTRAVAYAKTHLVAKYDLDNNGLSKAEISRMSLTGKRAVDLARALKGAGGADAGGRLSATQLGAAIEKLAPKASYMSESDYNPEFVSAAFPAGHDLNGHNVMTAFQPQLEKMFETPAGKLFDQATFEASSPAETKSFLKGLSETSPGDDADTLANAKAFGAITALITANLTDVHHFKVGPKDDQTGRLGRDQGLYSEVIVGRTADGKVAGIMIGNVQT